jgi:ABC-type nitrate/sulfonate/bicarbonate transport system permease component
MRFGLGHLLDREVGISRAVPVVAMLPILIIWFGFSEIARTLIVSFSALTMIFPMIHDSIRRLPRTWQLIGERGRLSWWRNYLEVYLPWSLPEVGSGLRVVMAVALGVSIATEYMGAENGVGKFLDSARGTFNLPGLWLGMLLIGFAGGLADRAIVAARERFLFWSRE